MKKNLILTIVLSVIVHGYVCSQFVVGENASSAEKKMKQYLKSKGFNFFKKDKSDDDLIELLFSEEFTVVLFKNSYGNASSLNVSTAQYGVWEKLKKVFYFPSWEYKGEGLNNKDEPADFYAYKGYQIRVPKKSDSFYQFIITLKSD